MYELLFTGSGIYKQQQDTYTQLTEGESVYLTEDITLVCVSSTAGLSAWYYRNISTVVEERITEGTEVMNSKGFLTLSLQSTNRAGYYICKTTEVTEVTSGTRTIEHSIIVPLPILTTTPRTQTTTTTTTITPTPTQTQTQTLTQTITPTPTPTTTPTTTPIPTTTTAPTPTPTPTTTPTPIATSNNTQAGQEDTLPYPIIGLIAGVLVILFLVIIVMILVIVFIVKRRKTNKSGYTEHIQTDNPEDTTTGVNNNNNKEYVNLQDLPIKRKPVPPPNTKKPGYNYKYSKKSLEDTTPPVNTSDKKEYISLSDVHTGTKIQQTHNYEPMASVYPPHNEYIPLEVTTRPNYSEIPDSHFDSENDSKDRKYENLASIIST